MRHILLTTSVSMDAVFLSYFRTSSFDKAKMQLQSESIFQPHLSFPLSLPPSRGLQFLGPNHSPLMPFSHSDCHDNSKTAPFLLPPKPLSSHIPLSSGFQKHCNCSLVSGGKPGDAAGGPLEGRLSEVEVIPALPAGIHEFGTSIFLITLLSTPSF